MDIFYGILIVMLGETPCIMFIIFNKWLHHQGVKTHFAPVASGALFLAAAIVAALRIMSLIKPEDASLLIGVVVMAGITVLSSAIVYAATND